MAEPKTSDNFSKTTLSISSSFAGRRNSTGNQPESMSVSLFMKFSIWSIMFSFCDLHTLLFAREMPNGLRSRSVALGRRSRPTKKMLRSRKLLGICARLTGSLQRQVVCTLCWAAVFHYRTLSRKGNFTSLYFKYAEINIDALNGVKIVRPTPFINKYNALFFKDMDGLNKFSLLIDVASKPD